MLEFNLGIPQIIWITLVIFGGIYAIIHHGEEREPYNAYVLFISTVIEFALLYWGGFFN